MYDLPRDLIDALKATPEVLSALLQGVNQSQAAAARGGDEGWSVLEVICHLRDAEEICLQRMEAMRDRDNPPISGYDQEALARDHNYQGQDLHQVFSDFFRFRQKYLAGLTGLQPADWDRPGQHNEFGHITILQHTVHHACHDAIHCAQIARQLAAGK